MNRKDAYNRIDAIIAKHEIDDEYVTINNHKDYDALRMARKALEQEPCEDAIGRSDMLDAIGHGTTYTSEELQRIIKGLPPVIPQPKIGCEGCIYEKTGNNSTYPCSHCGRCYTDKYRSERKSLDETDDSFKMDEIYDIERKAREKEFIMPKETMHVDPIPEESIHTIDFAHGYDYCKNVMKKEIYNLFEDTIGKER